MFQLTQQEKFCDDYDPQVDLKVERFMIPQVMVNFGSHVNIQVQEFLEISRSEISQTNCYLKRYGNSNHGDNNYGQF
jgi:hypothetical protein